MSDTKRLKRDAVSAEEAEEYQAASSVDEEQLENGEDGAGEGEIAAEGEHDYAAEDNEFIKALEDVQEKLVEVNDEASDKVLQIEQEYNLKRQPIYKERNIVIRQLPDFWHRVFKMHETLGQIITSADEEGLAHLQEVSLEDALDIKSGFRIVLTFLENRFFQNLQLEKNIRYLEDGTFEITTVGPEWNPGQSLTEDEVYESGKPTGSKRKRDALSFFSWLEGSIPQDSDLEIAEIIKEQIWPNPLTLYQSEALVTDGEGPIELLDDDDEEEGYDEEGQVVEYDEAGNPIVTEYVEVDGGDYEEGEGAEEYYEEGEGAAYEEEEGDYQGDEGEQEEAATEEGAEAATATSA